MSFALADVDISNLSYDELVSLVNEAQMLMMKSDKWQRVEVPTGVYEIGKDIPEGYWTISPISTYPYISVSWGTKLDDTKRDIARGCRIDGSIISGPDSSIYEVGDATSVSWQLMNGQYLIIERGTAVFTPFTGNSFTFK